MKNKKGFTLIEILSVIVILAVVFTLGAVSISGVRKKIDKNLFEQKLQAIVKSAENYGIDNVSSSETVSVYDLILSGYLEVDETVLKGSLSLAETCIAAQDNSCIAISHYEDGKSINMLKVKIYLKNKRVNACIIKNDNNKSLLKETDDYATYEDLNLYCS